MLKLLAPGQARDSRQQCIRTIVAASAFLIPNPTSTGGPYLLCSRGGHSDIVSTNGAARATRVLPLGTAQAMLPAVILTRAGVIFFISHRVFLIELVQRHI